MGTDVVIGTSWSHRLARILVRPLVGSGVTPNDLTTLRLATGLLACGALFPADGAGAWWGGGLWLVSAGLVPARGGLARLRGTLTPRAYRLLYSVRHLP